MRIPMPRSLKISDADKRALWHHMRTPTYSFVALLALLGLIVLLGAFLPVRWSWVVEAGAVTAMVLTVLLFSMEVLEGSAVDARVRRAGLLLGGDPVRHHAGGLPDALRPRRAAVGHAGEGLVRRDRRHRCCSQSHCRTDWSGRLTR